MKCKDFEKQIPLYQDNMLSTKELSAFVTHLDDCRECQEEMTIYYLVNEGIMHLEEEGDFDLQKIMGGHRERLAARLQMRHRIFMLIYASSALLLVVAAVIFFSHLL